MSQMGCCQASGGGGSVFTFTWNLKNGAPFNALAQNGYILVIGS